MATAKDETQVLNFTAATGDNVENVEVATDEVYVYTRSKLNVQGKLSKSGKSNTIAMTGFPKVLIVTKDGRAIMIGMTVGIKN